MKNLIKQLMNILNEYFYDRIITTRINGVVIEGEDSKFRIRFYNTTKPWHFAVRNMDSKDLYTNLTFTDVINLIK